MMRRAGVFRGANDARNAGAYAAGAPVCASAPHRVADELREDHPQPRGVRLEHHGHVRRDAPRQREVRQALAHARLHLRHAPRRLHHLPDEVHLGGPHPEIAPFEAVEVQHVIHHHHDLARPALEALDELSLFFVQGRVRQQSGARGDGVDGSPARAQGVVLGREEEKGQNPRDV